MRNAKKIAEIVIGNDINCLICIIDFNENIIYPIYLCFKIK